YGVFEDVAIEDRSSSSFELHVAGAGAFDLVNRALGRLPEDGDYSHVATAIGEHAVQIVRESPVGLPGLTLIGDRKAVAALEEILTAAGAPSGISKIDPMTLEAMRIEAGTPVFGKDITEKNLPQEIGRDSQTISFVKGCYLGQETVARIDALGHVN